MESDPPRLDSEPPDDDSDATRITKLSQMPAIVQAAKQQTRAYLVVIAGANVGEMHRIDADQTVLGRAMTANIRIFDDGVSRAHARIVRQGTQIAIEDAGSANGTLVNGETVTQRVLQDGDKIQLGSTTILKFTYHDKLDESFQRQMYDAALRDGLTRAFNKKYFVDRLETEFAFARRHQTILSLVMFDADHFKRVNDTLGHPAGDYVLVRLAAIAQATIRTEDIFARYGGEEFAVICRGTPVQNAAVLGERIRAAVETNEFVWEGQRVPVTISVGVAGIPDVVANSSAGLVAAADAALYESKMGGRNRVSTAR